MWTEFALLLTSAVVFASMLMALTWLLARRLHNAGVVDIVWSAGFAPVAVCYALLADGHWTHRAAIAVMVALWSLRLAAYLLVRVRAHHPQEDRRYARLRAQWQPHTDRNMFAFFQLQGLLLALLSTPFLLACLNPANKLSPLEWIGASVWLVALLGESGADRQLRRFRADPSHRNAVCDVGWWRYSRHPNYFFEWLNWMGYFLFASASPYGWISFFCPALMLYFLLRVTGIPLTEQLSLESKGAAFADYQRRTSAFLPWFPKH